MCGLVVVRDMRYMADALRCSYVVQNEDKTPEGARRVMTRVKNAHSEHERASELASALLDRLVRRIGLISELLFAQRAIAGDDILHDVARDSGPPAGLGQQRGTATSRGCRFQQHR